MRIMKFWVTSNDFCSNIVYYNTLFLRNIKALINETPQSNQ